MIQLAGQLVPVKLDAEHNGQAKAAEYKVQGFPAILFLDKDGKKYGAIAGYLPPKEFAAEMEKYLNAFKDLPALEERVRKDPNDVEALGQLIPIRSSLGEPQACEELLERLLKADAKNEKGLHSKACAAVGDCHQGMQAFEKAIPFFRKAAESGKTPTEIAYARLSIAACSLDAQDPKTAVAECEAVLQLKDVTAEDKETAEKMLQHARGAGEGK